MKHPNLQDKYQMFCQKYIKFIKENILLAYMRKKDTTVVHLLVYPKCFVLKSTASTATDREITTVIKQEPMIEER